MPRKYINHQSFSLTPLYDNLSVLFDTTGLTISQTCSIELVIKLPSFESKNIFDIGILGNAVNYCYALRQSTTNKNDLIFSFLQDRTKDFTISNIASDMQNNWTHIIITYNNTNKNLNIYKNGILFTTIVATGFNSTSFNTNFSSVIKNVTVNSKKVSDFPKIYLARYYNSALAAASVTTLYNLILSDTLITTTQLSNFNCQVSWICKYKNISVNDFLTEQNGNVLFSYNMSPDSIYANRKYQISNTFTNSILSTGTSYISIPYTTQVTTSFFTISMWLKITSIPTVESSIFGIIPSTGTMLTNGISISILNNNLIVKFSGTEGTYNYNQNINFIENNQNIILNKWNLFTFFMRSDCIQLNINDCLSSNMSINSSASAFNPTNIIVGSTSSFSGLPGFPGEIGPVYIFSNRATNESLISLFQNQNIPSNNITTLLLTKGTGTTLNDSSGLNNTSALSSASAWNQIQDYRNSRNTYAISLDFYNMNAGIWNSIPSILSFSRGSVATVQTSANNVLITGINANIPRIGDDGYGRKGLIIEEPRTNYQNNSSPLSGWTTSNSTISTITGPAGENTGGLIDSTTSFTGNATNTIINTSGGTAPLVSSGWIIDLSNVGDGTIAMLTDIANGFTGTRPIPLWTKYSGAYAASTSSNGTTTIYATTQNASLTGTSGFEFLQVEKGYFPTESIITSGSPVTRSGDRLWLPDSTNIIFNGQVSIEVAYYAKGDYNKHLHSQIIFFMNASNKALITGGTVSVVVGGVTLNSTSSYTFNQNDLVELWLNAGNGIPSCTMRINGGTKITHTFAQTTLSALPSSGTIDLLCAGEGGNQINGRVRTLNVYNYGFKPRWV